MSLTVQELELAATLLKSASEEFANHGCNDLDLPASWTQEQCDAFTLAMHTWNGDPEDHYPGDRIVMDWFAMSYLAAKLKEMAEKTRKVQ